MPNSNGGLNQIRTGARITIKLCHTRTQTSHDVILNRPTKAAHFILVKVKCSMEKMGGVPIT